MNNYIFYGVIIIILIIFYYSTQTNLVKIRATNNKIYYTQKKDALIAAEKLVKIDKFIQKLSVHLLEDHPLHKLIQKKMKHNIIIKELPKNSKHIAYIINKTKLHVCLRNKNGTFIDQYNRIYFVVMHELAHMITKTNGHTDEYWNNYKLIIETAVKHKLYTYKNYFDSPVEYCGKDINSTPYIKGGFLENNKIEISTIIGIVLLALLLYVIYNHFYNNSNDYELWGTTEENATWINTKHLKNSNETSNKYNSNYQSNDLGGHLNEDDDISVYDPNYNIHSANRGCQTHNIWGEKVIRDDEWVDIDKKTEYKLLNELTLNDIRK